MPSVLDMVSEVQYSNVVWATCGDDNHWCALETLKLPLAHDTSGVYIIWHEGSPPHTVDVGQGDISDRLDEHQNDKNILRHNKRGKLRVTWTSVDKDSVDGVERYLADTLKPLEGRRWPKVPPIKVNLPEF